MHLCVHGHGQPLAGGLHAPAQPHILTQDAPPGRKGTLLQCARGCPPVCRAGCRRAVSTPWAHLLPRTPKGATRANGVCVCTSCFLSLLHPCLLCSGHRQADPFQCISLAFLLIGLGPWAALSEIIRLEQREVGCFLPSLSWLGRKPCCAQGLQ